MTTNKRRFILWGLAVIAVLSIAALTLAATSGGVSWLHNGTLIGDASNANIVDGACITNNVAMAPTQTPDTIEIQSEYTCPTPTPEIQQAQQTALFFTLSSAYSDIPQSWTIDSGEREYVTCQYEALTGSETATIQYTFDATGALSQTSWYALASIGNGLDVPQSIYGLSPNAIFALPAASDSTLTLSAYFYNFGADTIMIQPAVANEAADGTSLIEIPALSTCQVTRFTL